MIIKALFIVEADCGTEIFRYCVLNMFPETYFYIILQILLVILGRQSNKISKILSSCLGSRSWLGGAVLFS